MRYPERQNAKTIAMINCILESKSILSSNVTEATFRLTELRKVAATCGGSPQISVSSNIEKICGRPNLLRGVGKSNHLPGGGGFEFPPILDPQTHIYLDKAGAKTASLSIGSTSSLHSVKSTHLNSSDGKTTATNRAV